MRASDDDGQAPDRQNDAGEAALHKAAEGGWDTVVLTLLEAGASLGVMDCQGRNAAMVTLIVGCLIVCVHVQVAKEGTDVKLLLETWAEEYAEHMSSMRSSEHLSGCSWKTWCPEER